MSFRVETDVDLVPPAPFAVLGDSEDFLRGYGWRNVLVDRGPIGKLAAPETRRIVYGLDGKPGATQRTAEIDVQDALHRVGLGTRFIRAVETGVANAPKAAGMVAGEGLSGFGKGVGLGGGVGALAAGTVITAVVLAVVVVAAVVAFKKT